jgi:penicillin-binding protein 1A
MNDIQVISPQNAYIMTSLLRKTVEMGTLAYGSGYGSKFTFLDENGNRYRIPAAGKTGTTQNWADAWAVGFTPYYTTAIWFGFDKPGNSLGLSLTGATLAGPVWGDFMREIHQGLPRKDFVRPSTGIVDVTVCSKSGLLPTPACPGLVTLSFLAGTQPTEYCTLHGENAAANSLITLEMLRMDTIGINDSSLLGGLKMPQLQLDLLPEAPPQSGEQPSSRNQAVEQPVPQNYGLELPSYNPLLE